MVRKLEGRQKQRAILQVKMSEIAMADYKKNSFLEKQEKTRRNQKWLNELINSFLTEFQGDEVVIALVEGIFEAWRQRNLRRDFSLAFGEIKKALGNCSADIHSRFNALESSLKKQYEEESRREEFKKAYAQFQMNKHS